MSKIAILKLSPKDTFSDIDNAVGGGKMSVREIELSALENLAGVAAADQKELRKANTCYDLVDEIKRLKEQDEVEVYRVSKGELDEFIITAFGKTAGQRPTGWFYARNLFKQFEQPEIEEVK
ncbi:MAG: hypothetical protein JXA71_14930 [Chitinispirillaceae bacterium]|nr:hypothetical protein [Chitinispirillaceae bacterium]